MTELLNLYRAGDFLRELADQNGCALHESPVSYRVDRVIQCVGRILMDDFLWTGTLSAMMIDLGRRTFVPSVRPAVTAFANRTSSCKTASKRH